MNLLAKIVRFTLFAKKVAGNENELCVRDKISKWIILPEITLCVKMG